MRVKQGTQCSKVSKTFSSGFMEGQITEKLEGNPHMHNVFKIISKIITRFFLIINILVLYLAIRRINKINKRGIHIRIKVLRMMIIFNYNVSLMRLHVLLCIYPKQCDREKSYVLQVQRICVGIQTLMVITCKHLRVNYLADACNLYAFIRYQMCAVLTLGGRQYFIADVFHWQCQSLRLTDAKFRICNGCYFAPRKCVGGKWQIMVNGECECEFLPGIMALWLNVTDQVGDAVIRNNRNLLRLVHSNCTRRKNMFLWRTFDAMLWTGVIFLGGLTRSQYVHIKPPVKLV